MCERQEEFVLKVSLRIKPVIKVCPWFRNSFVEINLAILSHIQWSRFKFARMQGTGEIETCESVKCCKCTYYLSSLPLLNHSKFSEISMPLGSIGKNLQASSIKFSIYLNLGFFQSYLGYELQVTARYNFSTLFKILFQTCNNPLLSSFALWHWKDMTENSNVYKLDPR